MKKFFSNPLVVLVILVFSFFLPNLLQAKVPIPADSLLGLYHPFRDQSFGGYNPGKFPVKNPLITDPVLQTYPWRMLAIEKMKSGLIPLWNPYSFSGQPLLANIQSASFQITNVLFFLLPFKIAWVLQVILPTLFTAVFMYLFLKEIGLSKEAAFFAGLVLPFTGFFVAWLTWGTVVTSAMWLPAILLLIEKIYKKVSPAIFLLLVFATSQTVFAGHSQTALYVLFATVMYLVFKSLSTKHKTIIKYPVCAIGLGLLLSAVQTLPALEFIQLSSRSIDQGFVPGRPDWFVPYQNLIQILAPDFFGNPTTYNYWGVWNYAEFVSFIGIIPLGFSIFSFFKKDKRTLFFLTLLAAGLVLATENPISKIPYTYNFPLISSFQPSRIIFLVIFSLTALSGFGLEYFLNHKPARKTLILPGMLMCILIFIGFLTYFNKQLFPHINNLDAGYIALRNLILPLIFAGLFVLVALLKVAKTRAKILLLVIIGLTLTELFRFSYKFTPFSRLSQIFPQTGTTDFLTSREKPFRIMTMDRRLLHPNVSSAYKIESIDGYDPLYLKKYSNFITVAQSDNPDAQAGSFNRIVTPQQITSKLINLLNVEFVLSLDPINSPDFELAFQEGETKIYKNKKFLPRMFFVNEVIEEQSKNSQYQKLLSDDFDIATKATAQSYAFPLTESKSTLNIEKYSDQSILLTTNSETKKPLIVSNVFYPGWKAYIDGRQTPIHEADVIFQLVEVPRGQHKVEFKFRPQSFYNGLYVSALALFLSFAAAFLIWQKRYRL